MHSIYVSTFAILFFGTPHDGSNKAKLASTSRRMVGALVPSRVVDTEGQLLDALQEGSEVLQNITDVFAPLMKKFHIFFPLGASEDEHGVNPGLRPFCIVTSQELSMLILAGGRGIFRSTNIG